MPKTYEARGPMASFRVSGSKLYLGSDLMESLPRDIASKVSEDNRSYEYLEAVLDQVDTVVTQDGREIDVREYRKVVKQSL